MSLFRAASLSTAEGLIAERVGLRTSSARVSREKSLSHSAVWACLRLRADLISTMPVDVFRRVDGVQLEVTRPPVLVSPDGKIDLQEWLYSTQVDLDSSGNAFGLVTQKDARGLPGRIELVPLQDVTVRVTKGVVSYQFGGDSYAEDMVWHERQFTTSGSPVGLSPTAHAAMSLSGYLSAQDFTRDWFSGHGIPAAMFRNRNKTLTPAESTAIKAKWDQTVQSGGLLVTGNDWEYQMIAAKASEATAIDSLRWGIADAARYFGVPGDMIDAETSSGSITYANVTQRNLQLLIINLGPAVVRRETALGRLTPPPRFVKLNPDALLRMDLATRYAAHKVAVDGRFLAPSEVRALENRQPFTPEQEAEFERLFSKDRAGLSAAEVAQKVYLAVKAGVITVDEARQMIKDAGANL